MNQDKKDLKDSENEKLQNGYTYLFEYLIEKLRKEYKVFTSIYIIS